MGNVRISVSELPQLGAEYSDAGKSHRSDEILRGLLISRLKFNFSTKRAQRALEIKWTSITSFRI
jgi:hypothetical protein